MRILKASLGIALILLAWNNLAPAAVNLPYNLKDMLIKELTNGSHPFSTITFSDGTSQTTASSGSTTGVTSWIANGTSTFGTATAAGTEGQLQVIQGSALAGASVYNDGAKVWILDPLTGGTVFETVSTGVSAQLKGGALYGVQLYTPLLMAFPLNGISGASTFLPETLESFAVTGVTFALPGLVVGPAGVSVYLNDIANDRLLYNVTIPAGSTRYVSSTGTTSVPKGTAIIVVEGTFPSGTSVGTIQFSGTRN